MLQFIILFCHTPNAPSLRYNFHDSFLDNNLNTVYAIYFAIFGLGWGICESLISLFCDVFITMNSHILKWKFLRPPTKFAKIQPPCKYESRIEQILQDPSRKS